MSDTLQPFEQPIPHAPVCPFCGTDPMTLQANEVVFPTGAIVGVYYCGNPDCRKVIGASMIGLDPQKGGRIVRPS